MGMAEKTNRYQLTSLRFRFFTCQIGTIMSTVG